MAPLMHSAIFILKIFIFYLRPTALGDKVPNCHLVGDVVEVLDGVKDV